MNFIRSFQQALLSKKDFVLGAFVLVGFFMHYYFLNISAEYYKGTLFLPYERIFAGVEYAPFQYRLQPALILVSLSKLSLMQFRHLVLCIDFGALIGGYYLVYQTIGHLKIRGSGIVLALTTTFFGLGTILYPKPETYLAYLGVSLVINYLYAPHRKIIWYLACLVLVSTRVDILFVISAVLAGKSRTRALKPMDWDFLTGFFCVGVMFIFLKLSYPNSVYPPGVKIFQLVYNLTVAFPLWFVISIPFIDILLNPQENTLPASYLSALRRWIFLYTVLVFFVGRIDELRLWFPFAGVVGIFLVGTIAKSDQKYRVL